jgi:P pilus assembly chaperone PapD
MFPSPARSSRAVPRNRELKPCRVGFRITGGVLLTYSLTMAHLAAAQSVVIAPNVVMVTEPSRTAQVTVLNPTSDLMEVRVSASFGYPVTDARGETTMHFVAEPDTVVGSAVSFIRFSPHRFRLQPGETKLVRFAATPPTDLDAGEYWARVSFVARRVRLASAVAVAPDEFAKAGYRLQIETVIPLFFRTGNVFTSARISAFSAQLVGDTVAVRTEFVRRGSAAFLGLVTLSFADSAGVVLHTASRPLAVYHELTPVWRVPVGALIARRVRGGSVQLRISDERKDLPAGVVMPFPAMVRRVGVP